MGSTVGDRFIAAVEESFETYYEEDREPVPPPELTGPTVVRLEIPALGVSAAVAPYGLDRAGRLDVPQDTATVGWNPGFTSTPGAGGSTFFAAHYEYLGRPGVFHELSSLRPGDEIRVTLSDGGVLRYKVTSTLDYALATIDMGAILAGREGVESLTLMTCSGPGDGGRYPLRTVVLAEAVPG
jgi:LPXTG-site transpeptidase (sortase) family protein